MEFLLCAPDLSREPDGCPGPLCLSSERHLHAEEEIGEPSSTAESWPSSTPTAALLHVSSDLSEQLVTTSQQEIIYEQAATGKAKASKASRPRRTATAATSGSRPHKKQCTANPTAATAAATAVKATTAAARAREEELDDDCDDELSGAAGPGPGERKGPIKHSTVEKQRRDRINTLIDLLAEQVPPANSKYAGNQAAVRRPKHAVLSDTLALLASIRAALKEQEETLAQLAAAAQVEQPPNAHRGKVGSFACAVSTEQGMPAAAAAQVQAQAQVKPLLAPRGRAARVTKAARALAEAAMTSRAPAAAAAKAEQPMAGALDAASPPGALPLVDTVHQNQNPTSALTDAQHPDICVLEVSPGHFHVVIRCLHKSDLHSDLREGLSNLPVTLDQVSLSDGCEDGFTHATLRVSSAVGSAVTSDQLHLALCMSVCWGCTTMPQLQLDGGLQDVLEVLNPMDVCWDADGCGTMAQPGDWGMDALHMTTLPHMHSSASSASIDSWIDDM